MIWAIFAAVTAILAISGNLNAITLSILGFFAFGHTFMGMIGVLPLMAAHPTPKQPKPAKPVAAETLEVKTPIPAVLKSA